MSRPLPPPSLLTRARALLNHRGFGTALLTALLVGIFVLGVARGRLVVRDGGGVERVVPVIDVWRVLLDRLPPQAPGLLARGPLLVLLALATLAAAYALVATLRLPRPPE